MFTVICCANKYNVSAGDCSNMSFTLDLGSNNLCISEDAFNKFQAGSMYKKPAQIARTKSLCNLVYDNEVIVGTEIEINTTYSERNPSPTGNQNKNLADEQLKGILEKDNVPQQNSAPQPDNEPQKDEEVEKITLSLKKCKGRKQRFYSVSSKTPSVDSKKLIGLERNEDSEEELSKKKKSKRAKKTRPKSKPKSSVENEKSYEPSTSQGSDRKANGNKRTRRRPSRYASSKIHLYSMAESSDSNQSDTHLLKETDDLLKSVKSTYNMKTRSQNTSSNHEAEEIHHETSQTQSFTELCQTLQLNPVKQDNKKESKIKILSDVKLTGKMDLDNMALSLLKTSVAESNTTYESSNDHKHVIKLPLEPYNKNIDKPKGRSKGRPRKASTLDNSPEKGAKRLSTNENKEIRTDTSIDVNETIDSSFNNNNTTSEANTILDTDINKSFANSHTKMPAISDLTDSTHVNQDNSEQMSLPVRDSSKRPIRKKGPVLQYQEESDEDPFANFELSEDEYQTSRTGKRYSSDDEYVPKKKAYKDMNSTDSEAKELINEAKSQRKKRVRHKKSDCQLPRKKTTNDQQHLTLDIDTQDNEVSVLTDDEPQSLNSWDCSNKLEKLLVEKIQSTNLQIKKVSCTNSSETKTLEIPMIDSEAKKTSEMCTQTNILKMASTGIQTSSPYDVPMKENIALTAEQSKDACEFLRSIVRTTSELGTLMTQKSEDFIKKKINTTHVNDTMKIDYCVKKSFLLLKLAKHNLMQMEEDLGMQYELFLNSNGLKSCRETRNEIYSTPNVISSDSDCEIVEEPIVIPKKICAKKIFLNKELSIKIKKIPSETKTLNILKKNQSPVLVGTTVVKRVQSSTQSFLAQDSRNKKPPDNKITTKMVSDFFKNYNYQRMLSICTPFVTTEWLNMNTESVCSYFVVKPLNFKNNVIYPENGEISMNNTASNNQASGRNNDLNNAKKSVQFNKVMSPESLFKICYRKVRNQLHEHSHVREVCQQIQNELTDGTKEPLTLFQLSLRALAEEVDNGECSTTSSQAILSDETSQSALPLKKLCYQKVVELLNDCSQKDSREVLQSGETSLSTLAFNELLPISSANNSYQTNSSENGIKTLLTLCVEFIQRNQVNNNYNFVPKPLKYLTFKSVKRLLYGVSNHDLMLSSHINWSDSHHDDEITTTGLTINSVNTLSEEAFLNLEMSHADILDNSEQFDDFDYEDHYGSEFNETEDNNHTEINWVSQVQLKELRSCVNTNSSAAIKEENLLLHTQFKVEPVDDLFENVDCSAFIKIEPIAPRLDEMTMFPNVKPEPDDQEIAEPIVMQNISGYGIDDFEQFVTSNKLTDSFHGSDIYSQSALRVRKQHEPDYYEEVDTSMSLLVPQTYEPLSVDKAKGSLMEISSDEDKSKTKKGVGKKKVDKRNKGKNKKLTSKAIPAQTKSSNVEVANLTKKMRDRITQEEERDASADSDDDDLPLRLRKRKDRDNQEQTSKTTDSEIQCNNVDSTDKVDEVDKFTGFTAIDQNETFTYQKYMKYVYDKIIPKDDETPDSKDTPSANESQDEVGEVVNPDEPVELLECEPTMPIFDDIADDQNENIDERKETLEKPKELRQNALSFVDRHGWHCYPLDPEDNKLYLTTRLVLEKLPESFFQTYFQYQNMNPNEDDAEISR